MEKAELLAKAVMLGHLLVRVDETNPMWHGMYADTLIVKGDFDEATYHLQIVMKANPEDATALARSALINAKMNRFNLSCQQLIKLTELDRHSFAYVLKTIDHMRRSKIFDESLALADTCIEEARYETAYKYYSLCLVTSTTRRIDVLRMRAACSVKCDNINKALRDITEVIKQTKDKNQANDYYIRANINLMNNEDSKACSDFSEALRIDKSQVLDLIDANPGLHTVTQLFHRHASSLFKSQHYEKCIAICDVGVILDDSNVDLRKLRARSKRESSKAGCHIQ